MNHNGNSIRLRSVLSGFINYFCDLMDFVWLADDYVVSVLLDRDKFCGFTERKNYTRFNMKPYFNLSVKLCYTLMLL